MYSLPPPFNQIDLFSFSLGAGGCFVLAVVVFLLTLNKAQRRQLTLSLRLERLQDESHDLEDELSDLRHEFDQLLGECRRLDTENGSLQTAYRTLQQQLLDRELLLEETREQIKQEFRFLASQAIADKGEALKQEHATSLNLLLRPFQEQLLEFKKKVDDIHDRDSRDRVALFKEIEHLRQLNQQVSTDAANLAQALSGSNKLQGQWGEMILSRLLESSGLRNGREFATQVHHTTADGSTFKPDVLVYLPDNRTVIIDAKVSLKAFQEAHGTEDASERKRFIKQHLDSVKRQVSLLADKHYHQLTDVGSLDFVLLFIPIEGAFQLAVEQEPDILINAMQKKVILASPSTLLAILRTIHHLWRLDEQNRNSLVIAKHAGNLYDKFVGFVEALEEIGLRLSQTQQAWHTARNRLATGQGNLIARAEALKHLGVQASKELPDAFKHLFSGSGDPS
ncbi:DNA recombination protein RmuC [Desulfobulbus propionicus]